MESQIDIMVKKVAENLGAADKTPSCRKHTDVHTEKECVKKEHIKKEFLPKAKNDFIVAVTEKLGGAEKIAGAELAEGLARVCELINIPEEYLFQMYRLIKPNSGTKADYISLAAVLLTEFSAEKNADMLIRIMQRFDSGGQLLKTNHKK